MLELNFNEVASHYVLYNIVSQDGELLHLGIVPLNQLTAFSDVPKDLTLDKVIISVIMTDIDRMKLANHAMQTDCPVIKERIIKTVMSWSKSSQYTVKCIETGKVYRTAQECATANDLTYGALLKHLKGKKGFVTVKGNTYRRIEL